MKLLFHLTLIGILFTASKQEEEKTGNRFEIRNAGFTVSGHFSESYHNIQFDPKNIRESYLEGRAVVSSIRTGIKLRDNHLQGRQYFKAKDFPEITLQSKSIKRVRKNSYTGIFELTIKDITKQLEIPFIVEKSGKEMNFKATFALNRLDFEVGDKSMVLSDEVKVTIDISTPI